MIAVDVGHQRHVRSQAQERGVALVRFRHERRAPAPVAVAAGLVDKAANGETGIPPAGAQHARHHAGGGGLAVAAGHGDAAQRAHQPGEELAARQHRAAAPLGLAHLGIRAGDGGGNHHRVRPGHLRRVMPDGHRGAAPGEPPRGVRGHQVRAAHRAAVVQQHFRERRHAGAADADEMHLPPRHRIRWPRRAFNGRHRRLPRRQPPRSGRETPAPPTPSTPTGCCRRS